MSLDASWSQNRPGRYPACCGSRLTEDRPMEVRHTARYHTLTILGIGLTLLAAVTLDSAVALTAPLAALYALPLLLAVLRWPPRGVAATAALTLAVSIGQDLLTGA